MNHATASSIEAADPPPGKPAPGEAKPGARPGSDPEKKNDVTGAERKQGGDAPRHPPADPTEIDRSTDA